MIDHLEENILPMDNKDCIHKILNLIEDADTITDSFVDFNKIPQVEIDLLKEKIRELYDNVLTLDKLNSKLEVSEIETEEEDDTRYDLFELGKEEITHYSDDEEELEELEETAEPEIVQEEKQEDEITPAELKKMYQALMAAGKLNAEKENAEEKTETKAKQAETKEVIPEIKTKKVQISEPETEKEEAIEEKVAKVKMEVIDTTEAEHEIEVNEAEVDQPKKKAEVKAEKKVAAEKKPEEKKTTSETKKAEVKEEATTINDIIAKNQAGNVLASKLQQKPVKDLKTAIGLNDKFQYIRELFEGDADEMNKTLEELNTLSNFSEAITLLREKYTWDEEDTTVVSFLSLINRRYL